MDITRHDSMSRNSTWRDNLVMAPSMESTPIATTQYLHDDHLAYDVILENFHPQQITQPTSPCSSSHYAPIQSDHEHQQQQLISTWSCCSEGKPQEKEEGPEGEDQEELGAVKERMYRIAAMQPIDIDPATLSKPKRRNVRISSDPQSVAARQRRGRISERMRILQRLVPGGAKMDAASMLDEAIRYVKFLKKQVIRLESSNQNSPRLAGPIINGYHWYVPSENNATVDQ